METTAELRQKGYTNKIIIITGDLDLVTSGDRIPKGWLINHNIEIKISLLYCFSTVDVVLGKPVTSDQIEKAILD